jgi:hypothetical protein
MSTLRAVAPLEVLPVCPELEAVVDRLLAVAAGTGDRGDEMDEVCDTDEEGDQSSPFITQP